MINRLIQLIIKAKFFTQLTNIQLTQGLWIIVLFINTLLKLNIILIIMF